MAYRDRVVLVSGAASGIGRALAGELAAAGARLHVADRDAEGLERAAAAWGAAVRSRTAFDVTDRPALEAWIRGTAAAEGRLDALFNNAGMGMAAEFADAEAVDWERVRAVNLDAVVHACRAAWPILAAQQGGGHLVNTASLLGLTPSPLASLYSATKHGVVGLSRTLALEGAALGIRVSWVCPGYVDTAIFDRAPMRRATKDELLALLPWRLMPADRAARAILRAVARDRGGEILFPFHARLSRALDRWLPGLYGWANRRLLERHRRR
jgi:NAD(P)-dependent dehydrogenase (short-subunit alcohol dehydrogenase family)